MKKLQALLIVFLTAGALQAQPSEIYVTEKGAINGYDPVAYFTEGKPVEGKTSISYRWKDQVWYFSSADNLNQFKANPEKFAPQFGGYCAFGMSRGYKAKTDPFAWTIVNDKLYLNYNPEVKETWMKNQSEFIEKAEKNWPVVKGKE